jgi:hypothetical protein
LESSEIGAVRSNPDATARDQRLSGAGRSSCARSIEKRHKHCLHLILDNYRAHNHPNVKKWLEKHPRFHLHFTPTSSSWLNLVERWFGEITRKRIRRGVFKSVPELIAAINEYILVNNKKPKPFTPQFTNLRCC